MCYKHEFVLGNNLNRKNGSLKKLQLISNYSVGVHSLSNSLLILFWLFDGINFLVENTVRILYANNAIKRSINLN